MTPATTTELETARLVLKVPVPEDAAAFLAQANNPDVARNRSSLPHPVAMQWVQDYLKHAIHNFGDSSFSFGIYLKSGPARLYIGEILLSALYEGEPALAYWIGEDYWGKGLATEAAGKVRDFAFSQLGAPFLEADYFLDNPASGRVLEKCGFQPSGQRQFWSNVRMKFTAGQSMLLTREDWAKKHIL